jgi:hypothetical protein
VTEYAMRVDLTGSTAPTLGPGWHNVTVRGVWPDQWDAQRLRSEAAAHFQVPVEQVSLPSGRKPAPVGIGHSGNLAITSDGLVADAFADEPVEAEVAHVDD